MEIKNIIFDLNDVLVTWQKKDLNNKYIEELGVDSKTLWDSGNQFYKEYNLGNININELMIQIFDELKINHNRIKIAEKLLEENFSIVDGMHEILSKLQKNYKLILLAGDGEYDVKFKLAHFKFKHFFNIIHATCDLKLLKTNKDIYKKLCTIENIKPEETLFIDDLKKHINAAKEAKMQTILFKNHNQLENELAKLGVFSNSIKC